MEIIVGSKKTLRTLDTQVAITEVTKAIMYNTMGDDISNQIKGSPINDELLSNLIASRIRSNVESKIIGGVR